MAQSCLYGQELSTSCCSRRARPRKLEKKLENKLARGGGIAHFPLPFPEIPLMSDILKEGNCGAFFLKGKCIGRNLFG